jgi:cell division protein FtsN
MAPKDPGSPDGIQFVLGNRQVAAVLFMILVIMGLMSTIAYLAGRMTGPVRAEATARPQRRAEQVIFIDSAKGDKVVFSDGAAPIVRKVDEKPRVAVPLPIPEPAPSPQRYLQVVATDRVQAENAAARLADNGVPARVVPGPNEATFRVLAGPVTDQSHSDRLKETIERAGFSQPFPRIY